MKILSVKQIASDGIAMGKIFVVKKEEIRVDTYKISEQEIVEPSLLFSLLLFKGTGNIGAILYFVPLLPVPLVWLSI